MNQNRKVEIFSDDANHVKKFVFDYGDAVVESVLYKYPTYKERTVICCSVMSGCPIGCRFCGTGDFFVRNLTAEEIVDQVNTCVASAQYSECILSDEIQKFQIMFMSMGEPMLNQKELIKAIEILNRLYPQAALLISTSGPMVDYTPIIDIATKIDKVGLQFSIHESTDEARNKLIPFAKKLNLAQISAMGETFYYATRRKPFFNYCAGENNSSATDADNLMSTFDPRIWNATVSVICERDSSGMSATNDYQKELANNFSSLLIERFFDVRVFDPAGQDTIGGGCGQLWFVQDWVKNNPDKARMSCGAKLPKVHIPIKEAQ